MGKPRLDENQGAAMEQSNCNTVCTFPDRAASKKVRRNFSTKMSRNF